MGTESSKDVILVRVNQWRMPETNDYSGFVIFSRKSCGDDFLTGLADGRLHIDYTDKELQYGRVAEYYRLDNARTSTTLQYSSSGAAPASNWGSTKFDQAFMLIKGIEEIDLGNKDLYTCVSTAQVGSMALTTEDESGCVGWQKNVGFKKIKTNRK